MIKVKLAIASDCTKLIYNFARHENPEFKSFSKEWKNMYFQHIYSALGNTVDFIQLTEEIIDVAKEILINEIRSQLERIGALYLIYSIYFKQPVKQFCKIKLNMRNWSILRSFINEINSNIDQRNKQAVLVFYKLVQANAFRFVLFEFNYCFEDPHNNSAQRQRSISLYVQKTKSLLKDDLKQITNNEKGLLKGIETLEDGYFKMKSKIHNYEVEEKVRISHKLILGFKNIEKILQMYKTDDADNDGDSIDDIDDNEGIEKSKKKSIGERREEIRSKAKHVTNPDGEYSISLTDDFIRMTKNTKNIKQNLLCSTQSASKILVGDIPVNGLSEEQSDEDDFDELTETLAEVDRSNEPCTSQQAMSLTYKKRKITKKKQQNNNDLKDQCGSEMELDKPSTSQSTKVLKAKNKRKRTTTKQKDASTKKPSTIIKSEKSKTSQPNTKSKKTAISIKKEIKVEQEEISTCRAMDMMELD